MLRFWWGLLGVLTPKGWFPPGSGICLYPSHRFLATELGVGFDTSPLGIKLLFMGWQTSASGGTLPVAPLWGGNDANTNPGLSSWEIQEVCPRKGGRKTFVKVLVPLGPLVNALCSLCRPDSEE